MSLKNIIATVGQTLGTNLNDAADRLELVKQINETAKLFHDTNDSEGCKREVYFVFDKDTNIAALPWFVDKVFAVRDSETSQVQSPVDMSVRYNRLTWVDTEEKHRMLGFRPTLTEVYDAGRLKITCAENAAVDILINVVGSTTAVSQTNELITIEAGSKEAVGVKAFTNILSIGRDGDTRLAQDVSIWSVSNALIALLPNTIDETKYLWLQNKAQDSVPGEDQVKECLFKHSYVEMHEDSDVYVCGSRWDEVIALKTVAYVRGKTGGAAQDFANVAENLKAGLELSANNTKERQWNNPVPPAYRLTYGNNN